MKFKSMLLLAACLAVAGAPAPARALDTLAGLKLFGDFPHIDLKRLLEGEILSQRGPLMRFPNGISSQLCFAVATTPAETIKRLHSWDSKLCPALKVYASNPVHDPAKRQDFDGLQQYLDPGRRPVRWFIDQTRSTSGNSSVQNLTQIEARELTRCLGKDAAPRTVGVCWADVLSGRATDFQRHGFASALPYEFDVEPVTPAAHLKAMLEEQVLISREFAPLLQAAGLAAGGSASLRPDWYWRMFDADHHATLSLGAVYGMQVGERYQQLEVEYYVSGTYYTSATLYEVWPISYGGKTGSLVWCDVLCSAPVLRFASGIERLASGVILTLEFKKFVRCFQDSFKTP